MVFLEYADMYGLREKPLRRKHRTDITILRNHTYVMFVRAILLQYTTRKELCDNVTTTSVHSHNTTTYHCVHAALKRNKQTCLNTIADTAVQRWWKFPFEINSSSEVAFWRKQSDRYRIESFLWKIIFRAGRESNSFLPRGRPPPPRIRARGPGHWRSV